MNCDYLDAGRALMAAKLQRGDADSELAHSLADAFNGAANVPDYVAEAIGAVQAELKLRVRRSWHESQMAAGNEERLALEHSLTGHAARNSELCAQLESAKGTLSGVAYDVGEMPAKLIEESPPCRSLIFGLPDIRAAIAEAESVLGDND